GVARATTRRATISHGPSPRRLRPSARTAPSDRRAAPLGGELVQPDNTGGELVPADDLPPSRTAYPRTEQRLRDDLADAPIEVEGFRRPVSRCDLANCRGMCCYGGVFVNDEMAETLTRIAREDAAFFQWLGLELPEEPIVYV